MSRYIILIINQNFFRSVIQFKKTIKNDIHLFESNTYSNKNTMHQFESDVKNKNY